MREGQCVTVAVVGGDRRYSYLAEDLTEKGYEVYRLCTSFMQEKTSNIRVGQMEEVLPWCQFVILPMPVSTDNIHLNTPLWTEKAKLSECFGLMNKSALVLGGLVTSAVGGAAAVHGISIVDLLETEELAVKNAIPTAEGALQQAMELTDYTIFGANCIITGYGRISRLLATRLRAMGATVTITSRRSDHKAWIEAEGYQYCYTISLKDVVDTADIVFNTVPSPVLTRQILRKMKREALIVDLASQPGGAGIAIG